MLIEKIAEPKIVEGKNWSTQNDEEKFPYQKLFREKILWDQKWFIAKISEPKIVERKNWSTENDEEKLPYQKLLKGEIVGQRIVHRKNLLLFSSYCLLPSSFLLPYSFFPSSILSLSTSRLSKPKTNFKLSFNLEPDFRLKPS